MRDLRRSSNWRRLRPFQFYTKSSFIWSRIIAETHLKGISTTYDKIDFRRRYRIEDAFSFIEGQQGILDRSLADRSRSTKDIRSKITISHASFIFHHKGSAHSNQTFSIQGGIKYRDIDDPLLFNSRLEARCSSGETSVRCMTDMSVRWTDVLRCIV